MSTKEITLKIPFYHPLELHLSMTKVVLKGVKIINLSTVLHCVDMFSQDWHTQGHISIHFYIVLARVPSDYNWQEKPIRQSFAQSGLHPSILITGRLCKDWNLKPSLFSPYPFPPPFPLTSPSPFPFPSHFLFLPPPSQSLPLPLSSYSTPLPSSQPTMVGLTGKILEFASP